MTEKGTGTPFRTAPAEKKHCLHSYNIRNPSLVRTILARTNSRRFSIRVAGPAAWNALPKDLQSIPNLNLFLKKVQSWLVDH